MLGVDALLFIDSTRAVDGLRPDFRRRRSSRLMPPLRGADEDGARRALGADLAVLPAGAARATIESLARIALG